MHSCFDVDHIQAGIVCPAKYKIQKETKKIKQLNICPCYWLMCESWWSPLAWNATCKCRWWWWWWWCHWFWLFCAFAFLTEGFDDMLLSARIGTHVGRVTHRWSSGEKQGRHTGVYTLKCVIPAIYGTGVKHYLLACHHCSIIRSGQWWLIRWRPS